MARKKNYLNNRDLYDEIVKSKEQDQLTPKAEKMLVMLAERAIRKLTYVSDDDRQDCLQFALLDLLKYWRNFNPKYTNAFAYFTEIAKRGYAKGWNKIHPKKYKSTLSLDKNSGSSDHEGGLFNI
jgi:DNA-directed RNA polymerase specialized sigma subunit